MLLQGTNDSLFSILGSDGIYEFFELVLMSIVVTFFAYISIQFLKRSRRKEGFEVEKKLSLGYCFFMLSLAVGYGAYVLDRMWRFLFGERFFQTHDHSLLNRDYFLVTFFGMSLGFIFLSYVIEKHVLNRKVIVAWICTAGLVYTALLRFLESLILPISEEITGYLGIISYLVLMIVFVLLIVIYIKIARMAPTRSDIWNRAVAFIIGILIMVLMLVVGNNQLSNQGGFYTILGPIITLISVFIMYYGLSRSE